MEAMTIHIIVGCFGAFIQELIHWYELRKYLDYDKYDRLLKSIPYWTITGLMIICSGIATYIILGETSPNLRSYLIMGAAFPSFFKKAVHAMGRNIDLGSETIISNYFFIK